MSHFIHAILIYHVMLRISNIRKHVVIYTCILEQRNYISNELGLFSMNLQWKTKVPLTLINQWYFADKLYFNITMLGYAYICSPSPAMVSTLYETCVKILQKKKNNLIPLTSVVLFNWCNFSEIYIKYGAIDSISTCHPADFRSI